jgi:hypothetical protein
MGGQGRIRIQIGGSVKEFLHDLFFGFRCWLTHGRHHIDVGAGFQLCQVCDAHLLQELIKGDL